MSEKKAPEFNLIKRANEDPKSKVKAIAAFCFHCFGGTEDAFPDPGYARDIKTCTSKTCPLYPHRPFQEKERTGEQPEHLRRYREGLK